MSKKNSYFPSGEGQRCGMPREGVIKPFPKTPSVSANVPSPTMEQVDRNISENVSKIKSQLHKD
jgi:hypothetical protein